MEKHRYVLQILRVEFEDHLTTPSDLIYSNVTHHRDGIPQSVNSDYASFRGKTSFSWNTNEFILHLNPCSCDNSTSAQLQAAYPHGSPITLTHILNNTKTEDPQLQQVLNDSHFVTVEIKRTFGSSNPTLLSQSQQSSQTNHDDQSIGRLFLSTHDRNGLQICHLYNTALHHVGRVVILWFPMLPQMLISLPTYQQPEKKFFFADGDLHKKYLARRTLLTSFLKLLFKPTFPEDSDVYQDYWEELHTVAKDLQDLDCRAMFLEQLTPLEYQSLKALATGSALASLLQQQENPSKVKVDKNEKKDDKQAELHGLDENPPYLTHPSITSVFLTFLNMCLNLCNQTRDFTAVYHILQISSNFSYIATVLSALKGSQINGKSHTKFLCSAYSITKSHTASRSPNLWNFIYLEAMKLCDALYTNNQESNVKNTRLFKHLFWSRRLAHVSQTHNRQSQASMVRNREDGKAMSDSCPYQKLFFLLSSKYSSPSTSLSLPPLSTTIATIITSENSPGDNTSVSFVGDDFDDEKPSFLQNIQYRLAHHWTTIHGPSQPTASAISTQPQTDGSTGHAGDKNTGKIENEGQLRLQYERLVQLSPKDQDTFLIIQLIICTLFSIGQDTQQIIAFIIGLNLDKTLQKVVVSWWDSQQLIIETLLPDRALYKELTATSDDRWLHCRSTFGLPEGTEPSASLYPGSPLDGTGNPISFQSSGSNLSTAINDSFQNGDFWVQKQSTPTTTLVSTGSASNKQPIQLGAPPGGLHSSYSSNSTTPGAQFSTLPTSTGSKLDWGKEPKRPLPIHVSLVPPPDWTHYNEYTTAKHQAQTSLSRTNTNNNGSNLGSLNSGSYHTIVEDPLAESLTPPDPSNSRKSVGASVPLVLPQNPSQLDFDDTQSMVDTAASPQDVTGVLSRPESASSDSDFDGKDDSYHGTNSDYSDYSDYTSDGSDIAPDVSVGDAPEFLPSDFDDDNQEDDDDDFNFSTDDEDDEDAAPLRKAPHQARLSGKGSTRHNGSVMRSLSRKSLSQAIDELPMPSSGSEDNSDLESDGDDDDFVDLNGVVTSTGGPLTSPRNTVPGPDTAHISPPTPTAPSRPKSLSVADHSFTPRASPVPPTPSRLAPPIPSRTPSVARLSPANSNHQPSSTPPAPIVPITQATPAIRALTRRHNGQNKTSSILYNPVFTSVARRRHVEALTFFTEDLAPLQSLGFPEVGELIQDNSYSSLPGPMRRRNALQMSTTRAPGVGQPSRIHSTTTTTAAMDQSMMTSDQQLALQLNSTGWTRIPFEFMHGETSLLNLDVYCLDMPSILHYATRPRRRSTITGPKNNPNTSPQHRGSAGGSSSSPPPLTLSSSPQLRPQLSPILPLSSPQISTVTAPTISTTTTTPTAHPNTNPSFLTSHHPVAPSSTGHSYGTRSPGGSGGSGSVPFDGVKWFPALPVHHLDNMHISFSVSSNVVRRSPLPGLTSPPPHSLSYPRDIMIPTSLSTTQEHPHIEPDLEITVSSLQRILDDAVSRGRLTLTNYRLIYSPYVYVSPQSSNMGTGSNDSTGSLGADGTNNNSNTTTNNNNNNNNNINPHQHLFTEWLEPNPQPTHCSEPNCSRCIESRCRRVFGTIPLQSIHRLEIVDAHEAKAKSFQLSILDEFKKIDQSKHFHSLPEHQQLALQRNVSTLAPMSSIRTSQRGHNSGTGLPNFTDPDLLTVTVPSRPAPAPPGGIGASPTSSLHPSTVGSQPPALTTLTRAPSGPGSNSMASHTTLIQPTTTLSAVQTQTSSSSAELASLSDTPLTSEILFRLITQWCMGPQRPQFSHDGNNGHSEENSVVHSTYEPSTTFNNSTTANPSRINHHHHHHEALSPTSYGTETLMHIRCKDIRQVTFCIKHPQHGRSPQQLWAHFRHQLRQVAYAKPWESLRDAGPRCAPHVVELAKRIESIAPSSLKSLSQFFHLYAFILSSNKGKESNGWDIYNPKLEFERQGCTESGDFITYDNSQYQLCQTYPQHLVFQWRTRQQNKSAANGTMTTKELDDFMNNILPRSAKYRSKGRLPTVTFYHATTGGTILRSAQPLPGLTNSRSSQDQDLCNKASISAIFDARPKANAQANKMKGGGFEPKPELYNSTLIFCDIENIHKMRTALKTITTICREACPHVLVTNSYDSGIIHTAMIFQHAARIIATGEQYQRQQQLLLQQQNKNSSLTSHSPQGQGLALPLSTPSAGAMAAITTTTIATIAAPSSAPQTPDATPSTIAPSSGPVNSQLNPPKPRRGSFASSITVSQSNLHNYTGVGQPSKNIYIPSATDLIARCGVKTLPERYSQLIGSEWAGHITGMLRIATNIAQHVLDGKSCLVRCSDGWDRTAQMCCLAQIMVDPYFRTIQGFAVLIEKDFLSFGHKFSDRCGHGDPDHGNVERSPIFLQFLDAVFQLLVQNPTAFEFDDTLLHYLATHTYSCKYGTFLFNSHRERHHLVQAQLRTVSIWDVVICKHKSKFINPHYEPALTPVLKKIFPALPTTSSPDRARCCEHALTEIAEQSAMLWVESPWSPWNFYFRWDMRTIYEYKI